MLISLIVFCVGLLGVSVFLVWKAPLLAEISTQREPEKDYILSAKEKIEEGVKKEVKGRIEELLQIVLSGLRRFLLRVERITTKWLYTLRRNRKKREEEK